MRGEGYKLKNAIDRINFKSKIYLGIYHDLCLTEIIVGLIRSQIYSSGVDTGVSLGLMAPKAHNWKTGPPPSKKKELGVTTEKEE